MKPLLTRPHLRVDDEGNWWYKNALLKNEQVITYFKRRLKREGTKYYIENIFGNKIEHACLDAIEGFPLIVKEVISIVPMETNIGISITVRLDSKENIKGSVENLYVLGPDCLAITISDRGGVPARLNAQSMVSLAPYLSQRKDNDYFLSLPNNSFEHKLVFLERETFFHKNSL